MKIPLFKGQKQFYKTLFIISVPIMFHDFIGAMSNIFIVTWIARLGIREMAAVSLGSQVFNIYANIVIGITVGGTVFVAQFWGKRDVAGIRKTMGLCICINLCIALLFTLGAILIPARLIGIFSNDPLVIEKGAGYLYRLSPMFFPYTILIVFVLVLRSVEKPHLPAMAAFISLISKAVLSYLFMFGIGPIPAMGINGIALASIFQIFMELVINLSMTFILRYPPAAKFKEYFSFDRMFMRRYIGIAMPVIVNFCLWVFGSSIKVFIMARSSTEAIASYNLTNTIFGLTWVVFVGLGNGTGILIGKKIGEGNELEARSHASKIVRFMPLMSLCMICILLILSNILLRFMDVNPEIVPIVSRMIIVLCAVYPLMAFNQAMIGGICRSGGDTFFSMLNDLTPGWTIVYPLGLAACFIFHLPAHLLMLCLMLEEPLKTLMGLLRFKSGKWLHYIIHPNN